MQIGQAIIARREALAAAITDRQYAAQPVLNARYGSGGRVKCVQDALYHLDYLVTAIQMGSPILFTAYVAWAKVMLAARAIPAADLEQNLGCMQEVLSEALEKGETRDLAVRMIRIARRQLAQLPETLPACVADRQPLAELARDYLSALLRGDRHRAAVLVLEAVKEGVSVKDIYLNVFQRTQHEIGRLWQLNQVTVAQEHYCTAATQVIIAQLYPYIFAAPRSGRRLVATCVNGELHEISVRMVADFFEIAGWDTFYLGANVPAASITEMVARQRADVLGISATLTVNVGAVATLIETVRKSQVGGKVRILVGGYPFATDPELWRTVGADGYASDAEQAVVAADRLLAERQHNDE